MELKPLSFRSNLRSNRCCAKVPKYGGQYTTMSKLVSSCHPANAGVQVALVGTLVDFGAAVEARGSDKWDRR